MPELPSVCPFCGGELIVTGCRCLACETAFEGRFQPLPFARLTSEQWEFVKTFLRCEGKLKAMEAEIGLSYPTIRNRLHEIIRALGYEPHRAEEDAAGVSREQRQRALQALERGEITVEQALRLFEEGGGG